MRISLNRRRILLEKADEVDHDIADLLAAPVEKEAGLLDAIREAGGDETVEKAAAAYARLTDALIDAYGGKLPEHVAKAMRDALGIREPVRKAKPAATKPAAKPKRSADEIAQDVELLAKAIERRDDANASARLDDIAEQIRKSSGYALTKPQAMTRALEAHPDLYEAGRRHQLRASGVLKDSPVALRKAAATQSRLDAAAARVKAEDPTLTDAQAMSEALLRDKSLYADYLKGV